MFRADTYNIRCIVPSNIVAIADLRYRDRWCIMYIIITFVRFDAHNAVNDFSGVFTTLFAPGTNHGANTVRDDHNRGTIRAVTRRSDIPTRCCTYGYKFTENAEMAF